MPFKYLISNISTKLFADSCENSYENSFENSCENSCENSYENSCEFHKINGKIYENLCAKNCKSDCFKEYLNVNSDRNIEKAMLTNGKQLNYSFKYS